ncbi:MAG: hypothetical protein JWO94_2769 [Verrucomicrobiaceae bacterium]|nr:hypothetical protein [Verrucomicrobiaceae bacterium]
MLWRLATGLIVLFWAVMTVLLVRHTYFPTEAEFAPVPVKLLMERYAGNPNPSNTLQLMQGGQKWGNVTLAILDWKDPSTAVHKGYTLQAGGMVEPEPHTTPETRVTWSFSGDFTDDESWERLALGARSSGTDTFVNAGWHRGQDLPTIEVRKGTKVIMDTEGVLAQAKQGPALPGMGGLTSLIPGFGGMTPSLSLERLVRLGAREAALPMGGRPRKAFVLTASLMSLYQAKMWFTEAGEVVRIDLPNGFRLINPMLMGLENLPPRANAIVQPSAK